ncbi:FAD-binding and (Fe-S)-binding domain-containing protein [Dietzia psychralcaliphila]|nr:FAD-binding and (Fe-S)-binding domain-containing protein [Dietzia psychralcaliphila]PTM86070.1 FAD/FMN-containing dehydrogenase [Dietzia psychralcaliphila]
MTSRVAASVDAGQAPVEALVAALVDAGLAPEADPRRIAEYSYDASNYRVVPAAVLFPRTEAEVATALAVCHRLGVPATARGGGTSMAGNAIGTGLVLDLSRHMNRVLGVDEGARTVTAEAGCVLTALRAAVHTATDSRLTFAPDPSSQSRACLGGAIGNDACGNHSVRHGRTADHVESLRIVTADGLRLTATRSGIEATDPSDAAATARAEHLTAQLRDLAADHLAAIRTELGRLPRQVSGYHLRHLLPEEGFDVARSLVGSEGTCAVVTAATMRAVPRSARTGLLVVGYADVVDAARDVPAILRHHPTAVEGIDEVIVETMRERRGADAVAALPAGRAWLFVELDDDGDGNANADADDGSGSRAGTLDDRVAGLAADLTGDGHAVEALVVTDPVARADLWRVREDGAGLSSRLTDPATGATIESWPGWEDSAVAPERLADYLDDFRGLLGRHGLTGVMYGHFGAGCMHIRISFDLRSEEGRGVMRAFCTDAAHLAVSHGGSLSGEHGDGRARSELLPVMYSPEMLDTFARFARIWDPSGILAPGGLTATRPLDADLALAGVGRRDLGLLTSADGAHPVQACIGVGRCRTSTGGVMCPSFRATGDEKDSTRGRARVLQEVVRGTLPIDDPAVEDSLELCLACKACSSDCPTGVDMAAFKSEALHRRYRRRVRPVAHYSLGLLPLWLRGTARAARPLNAVLGTRAGRAAARLGGLATDRTLPRFTSASELRRELSRVPDSVWTIRGQGHPEGRTSAEIVLFLDSFTRGLRPTVAGAAARVLGGVHTSVACSASHCCGLTHVTTGRLSAARRTMGATARHLDAIRGPDGGEVPVVVVEPSCAATLREDLPRLLADTPDADTARRVAARIRSAADHLGRLAGEGRAPAWPGGTAPDRVTVQTHCHEYATFGNRVQRATLTALGVGSVREATGCCGVAGDFGFTAGHEAVTAAVAEQALAPALRADRDAPVLTDGFSCATQVGHLGATDPTTGSGRAGLHLFELLDPDPDHSPDPVPFNPVSLNPVPLNPVPLNPVPTRRPT